MRKYWRALKDIAASLIWGPLPKPVEPPKSFPLKDIRYINLYEPIPIRHHYLVGVINQVLYEQINKLIPLERSCYRNNVPSQHWWRSLAYVLQDKCYTQLSPSHYSLQSLYCSVLVDEHDEEYIGLSVERVSCSPRRLEEVIITFDMELKTIHAHIDLDGTGTLWDSGRG